MTYLLQVLQTLGDLTVESVDVVIFTETADASQLSSLSELTNRLTDKKLSIRIKSVPTVGSNLRLLPWAHKELLRATFLKLECPYTHFLYVEEDIRFGQKNLDYFITYNERLKPFGAIPGFIRVELNEALAAVCVSDSPRPNGLDAREKISIDDFEFVCLDEPYTGMYFLDASQAREYVESRSFDFLESEKIIGWGEPERAAIGLTFENPPPGHRWRTMLPLRKSDFVIDACSWVHHLPNNYSNNYKQDGNFPLGKLEIAKLFI